MAKRRSRGHNRSNDYMRKEGRRPPREIMGIIAEGTVSEIEYFQELKRHYGRSNGPEGDNEGLLKIVKTLDTDPNNLVQAALKKRRENMRQAKEGNGVVVDSWWVVVDRESDSDQGRRASLKLAEKTLSRHGKGINLVIDSPSIEYWFLLHFQYSTRDYDRSDQVIPDLRKPGRMPDYSKSSNSTTWSPLMDESRISTAITNAKRVESFSIKNGTSRPSAECYRVLEKIQAITGRQTL